MRMVSAMACGVAPAMRLRPTAEPEGGLAAP